MSTSQLGENTVDSGQKSAAIVVTYNHVPALEQFESALNRGVIDVVVLVDNNSNEAVLAELRDFSMNHNGKVIIQTNKQNFGLAKALNIGIDLANSLGCYWMYLLDHDAITTPQYFKLEKDLFIKMVKTGQKVGIVTCIVSNEPQYLGSKLWFRSEYAKCAPHIITSGILTNVRILKENRGFDERLFVDSVDLEFAARLSRNNYGIYRVNRVLVIQDFGRTIHANNLIQKASLFLYRAYSALQLSLNQRNVQRHIWPLYSFSRWIEIERSSRKLKRWRTPRIGIIAELFASYLLSEDNTYFKLILEVLKS